jgi:hypothetical protein
VGSIHKPSGAFECVIHTEQFHVGGEQPAHYRGRPKGCSEEVPRDRSSRGRDIASSALCPVTPSSSGSGGYVCSEMEKGWLLRKEPIISV